MHLNRVVRGWALVMVVSVLASACKGKEAEGPSTPDRNKVLNLVKGAKSYMILDMKKLAATGFVDVIKKNLDPGIGAKLDELTQGMGVDPFQAFTFVAVWGDDFIRQENVNMAMISELPSDKISKAIDFMNQPRTGENNFPIPNGVFLGDFEKTSYVASRRKALEFKDLGTEEGIDFYHADKEIVGVLDRKAILVSKTKEGVKQFWKTFSAAPATPSGMLTASTIFKMDAEVKQDKMTGFDATLVTKSGGLDVRMTFRTVDAAAAEELAFGMQQMKTMLKGQPGVDPKLVDILQDLKSDASGNRATISLYIPAAKLK